MTQCTKHRSRAILLVLVAVALATAGVVYAHWTDTLQVNAQVSTGNVAMVNYQQGATDDDGVNNSFEGVPETPAQDGTNYDRWIGTSSNDPRTWLAGARYDKDVARCRVTAWDAKTTTVMVENTYPSYHCTIVSYLQVTGTVPLRNQATRVWACGPGLDCSNPANFVEVPYNRGTDSFAYDSGGGAEFELVMQDNPLGSCGYQFDPGQYLQSHVGFHVLQGAAPGQTYQIRFALEEVNWNEWSLANCYGWDTYIDPGNGSGRPIP
jgi:predicted ribosomally synthesized peptide with SipW-like signal peptide